jgi:hypothetical protein
LCNSIFVNALTCVELDKNIGKTCSKNTIFESENEVMFLVYTSVLDRCCCLKVRKI